MSEQQEQEFSQIIDAGLEEIQTGKMTLEEVLSQHPEQAELIRPELEAAVWLASMQSQVAPRAGFVRASRKRVVERIKQESSSRSTKPALFGLLWPPRFAYRTAAVLVIVVMLLIASGGGVVSAAQNTVPGDGLYGVKRFTENVTYGMTADPVRRVDLSIRYSERRLSEVQVLIARGDIARVDTVLTDYQNNITQATKDLNEMKASQPAQAGVAAAMLKEKLAAQDMRLNQLKQGAPAAAVMSLDEAIQAASSGIDNADETFNTVNGITPTVTPTPTAVPSDIPTDVLPSTPEPFSTPTVPLNETPVNGTGTPAPGTTTTVGASSGKASPTPTPAKTKVNTPKPTNENRPTSKPEVPPGQEKKEPKPPKQDPPKADPPKADPTKGNSGKNK